MVVGDIRNKSKEKRETAKTEEGSEDSAFGVWGYPQADDCLALVHVSGIHHSVYIHSILDHSPLSLDSGINIIFKELRNVSGLQKG